MNNIKKIARDKNLSVSGIIEKTGLSKSFVYDVINEKSFPSIPTAQKIVQALDSTLDEVFPKEA
jgi:putative transcriptional regulator